MRTICGLGIRGINMTLGPLFFSARFRAIALAAGVGAALTGCANIASTPPNTPLAAVQGQFGAPTLDCTDRDGQRRVVWSSQPLGQQAWGGTVDAQDKIAKLRPLLTDEHFKVLSTGTWTQDEVRCEFGPPAIIDSVGLPSVRQLVWSYRYKENHVWNSLMYVFFGHDGVHVTKFHPGPDPLYERRFRDFGF